ncbi:LysR family transcriptional regulator [Janthinobacterium psychrotolerans]|uniref:DNA-binding transcriptional regulator, LysR family n=1 Tax=Janthinobacterium psychrotolerans TaxID=1747903 RepID=A0A1A7C3M2_9BURK|nr:LysR family transcriptional regulator [Janthinobacterium psychrotolerans]OBV38908.1 DNA-binding transcriptional regulator, LysR family [Janthinobacterium psychrotolerans]
MEALNHLQSFVLSAEAGSFSAAARRLGLTPAAVSKNVARLEASLGLRLFQRSTRKLTLTEGGERFLQQIGGALATLREAIANAAEEGGQPAGVLKISLAPSFGRSYVVPLLAEFIRRHPGVIPDCHFDNRQVDLIGEGFDVAIGGGIELTQGVVARELGHVRIVAAASPAYMRGRQMPSHPSDLAQLDGIARRSAGSGRLRSWVLRDGQGGEGVAEYRPRAIFDDPEAMAQAAIDGVGVALLPMPHALAPLCSGALIRLLPGWSADSGPLSLYYPGKKLLPAKTRVFVDYLLEQFRQHDFAAQMNPD